MTTQQKREPFFVNDRKAVRASAAINRRAVFVLATALIIGVFSTWCTFK